MTLTEFLLARIAEDEGKIHGDWSDGRGLHIITEEMFDRMLAECGAKRRIVAEAFEVAATIDGEWGCCHDADDIRRGYREPTPGWGDEPEPLPANCAGPEVAGKFLQGLALPYADHPDYDEAWRR